MLATWSLPVHNARVSNLPSVVTGVSSWAPVLSCPQCPPKLFFSLRRLATCTVKPCLLTPKPLPLAPGASCVS